MGKDSKIGAVFGMIGLMIGVLFFVFFVMWLIMQFASWNVDRKEREKEESAISYSTPITLYPSEATISDSQGTFTSYNFNTPPMKVVDHKDYVSLSWGGDEIDLTGNGDTFWASKTIRGKDYYIWASRASSTGNIYIITVKESSPDQTISITFK